MTTIEDIKKLPEFAMSSRCSVKFGSTEEPDLYSELSLKCISTFTEMWPKGAVKLRFGIVETVGGETYLDLSKFINEPNRLITIRMNDSDDGVTDLIQIDHCSVVILRTTDGGTAGILPIILEVVTRPYIDREKSLQ